MDKNFFTYDNLKGSFSETGNAIHRGAPLAVFGVNEAVKSLIVSCAEGPFLYVAADAVTAARAAEDIKTLSGKEPVLLVAKDEVLTYKKALSKDSLYSRIAAIDRIMRGDARVVTDIEAAIELVPGTLPRITIAVGGEYDFMSIPEKLIRMGYTRGYEVDFPGSFTVRGDVLDVFPVGETNPVKIDFFGDEVEKIRVYDSETSERLGEAKKIEIMAASDAFIEEGEAESIAKLLKSSLSDFKDAVSYGRASEIVDDFLTEAQGTTFSGASFFLPVLKNHCTLLDLLPPDTVIYFDEARDADGKMTALLSEHEERYSLLHAAGEVFPFSKHQLLSRDEFLEKTRPFRLVAMQQLAEDTRLFRPIEIVRFKMTPSPVYFSTDLDVSTDVSIWLKSGYKVILFTDGDGRMENLRDKLSASFIGADILPERLDLMDGVAISAEKLVHGVILHDSGLVIIGSGDLFVKESQHRKKLARRRGDMFTAPEIGDFVVHETHGIGRITGTRRLETGEGAKEYIGVEYRGGDMLYVPVESMDSLSKYTGSENPQLSKIGGAEFSQTKQKVIKSLKKMTIDLKALYAERSQRSGFAFPRNDVMMEEFESEFPYEETPDQLSSIAEIKDDMCSDKVMDRLLCGDVGYGKTEVALRAVYLCVLGGKQAALMCPSTVLSDQHFVVATERFASFGVKVAKLNRFVTKSKQDETIKALKEGKIDFVIGTHRLLSSDVRFKDLGLLILDEEQRFGVEHKERLKKLKTGVDCLTLSATPIPRTLHMSLSGIRDISTINTAPSKRLPVQTYVVEESPSLIRDACVREISRGGQVFILYNRVETISSFADKIKALVPEGKVIYCHGRMEKDKLERNMESFYMGEANILVTTTIIENGIDLPNANTLIIIDSDRFGVSQLYQLRGRVGRSSRLAYAYLTYKAEKIMTSDATERLKAIMQFTELGSGYKIAMRDLQIRGAGNVLGAEQHGHMDKVGYELYSKLLKEELTGKRTVTAELDIKTSAYIPESYIESSAGRMECYKEIAEIASVDDYKRVLSTVEDNYGKMPDEVFHLLLIALLKFYASLFSVKKITVSKDEGGILELSGIDVLKDGKIYGALKKQKYPVTLSMVSGPCLVFRPSSSCARTMVDMTNFLKSASTFAG
ncbi:MAG: transcription-repair coupling factor [Clostridia bacterium]|nr:transcription-repair coupling factor [Clostridia bacterium]